MSGRSVYVRSLELDGVSLHTLRWGDGGQQPNLVFLHGGGANAHWWSHIAPRFADRHHVVALDFRGHGASDHPNELATAAFRDDLDALLDSLGDSSPVLVGHSMGARVALERAARTPTIGGVVLVDPPRGSTRRSGRAARLALTLRRSYRTREEAVSRFRFLPPARHATEALRRSIAEHSVGSDGGGRYTYRFDPRWFGLPPVRRPVLSDLSCPILVVRGAESDLLTADGAAELARELPNCQLVEIPGAGHHVQIDQPEAFGAALESFLSDPRLARR